MEKIPDSFESVDQYLGSYIVPLLEETRAELCSSMEVISKAPFAELISLEESKPYGSFLYDVKVDSWRKLSPGIQSYKPKPGDIFILSDSVLEDISDLGRYRRTWCYASVSKVSENENLTNESKDFDSENSMSFKIRTSQNIEIKQGMRNSLFAVFLINLTTNTRTWIALHKLGNTKMLEEVLCGDFMVSVFYLNTYLMFTKYLIHFVIHFMLIFLYLIVIVCSNCFVIFSLNIIKKTMYSLCC